MGIQSFFKRPWVTFSCDGKLTAAYLLLRKRVKSLDSSEKKFKWCELQSFNPTAVPCALLMKSLVGALNVPSIHLWRHTVQLTTWCGSFFFQTYSLLVIGHEIIVFNVSRQSCWFCFLWSPPLWNSKVVVHNKYKKWGAGVPLPRHYCFLLHKHTYVHSIYTHPTPPAIHPNPLSVNTDRSQCSSSTSFRRRDSTFNPWSLCICKQQLFVVF